jgi:hypothetical protein
VSHGWIKNSKNTANGIKHEKRTQRLGRFTDEEHTRESWKRTCKDLGKDMNPMYEGDAAKITVEESRQSERQRTQKIPTVLARNRQLNKRGHGEPNGATATNTEGTKIYR